MSAKPERLRAVPQSPESRLRASFAREDEHRAGIAAEHVEQRKARAEYGKAHGLCMLPSLAKLREVLS